MKNAKSQWNIVRIEKLKSYDPPKMTILLLMGLMRDHSVIWLTFYEDFKIFRFFVVLIWPFLMEILKRPAKSETITNFFFAKILSLWMAQHTKPSSLGGDLCAKWDSLTKICSSPTGILQFWLPFTPVYCNYDTCILYLWYCYTLPLIHLYWSCDTRISMFACVFFQTWLTDSLLVESHHSHTRPRRVNRQFQNCQFCVIC